MDNKIGVIGAMTTEIEYLREYMNIESEIDKASMHFMEGLIGQRRIVLVQSGIGKVNAGICAQILIDCFGVTHIMNTGIAGSLDDALKIGDIVVSTDALQYDMDGTDFGYAPGQVPGLPVQAFPADEGFRKKAVLAVHQAAPELTVYEGRIVSGDQFVNSQGKKNEIHAKYGGLCTEMEGAAIAQCAWLNHIPFVILRSISDDAGEADGRSYDEIEAEAAEYSSRVTAKLLELL